MPVHLVPRCARRMSSAVLMATALACALSAAVLAVPAMADTSSITIAATTAAPEQAIPVDLSFSGTNALTGNAEVEAVVRPAGGLSCLSSYQEDTATFPGQDVAIFAPGAQSVAPGAYSVAGSFKPPAAGAYQVCAWLEQNQNSTDQAVTAPATLTVSARAPQVSQLTVTVPKDPAPNVSFPVAYTTQTDQQLSLYSVLLPAAEGPCLDSFELDRQADRPDTVLIGFLSPQVFGGPSTTTVATRQRTGFYLVCTWVEGPNSGEVDRATSTSLTVGTPTPPRPGLKLTHATASHRHGVQIAGSSASGFTDKLAVSAACGSSTARRSISDRRSRYSSRFPLPAGCRRAKRVKLTVSWAGSSAFTRQTVTRTVAIAR
jgi:hypothetical protein